MITMEDNNTMTFVCSELSTTMFQKLYDQKKSNRFCDLTLHVNSKVVRAHRNVLACSSPYFDSILKHHKIIREQLIITCLDSDIFNTILTYMYTGEITIEHSNVEELLKLADHFIITKVIEYCIEFLGTKLNLDNCLFTYFLTQRFKLKHLGNIVENWIVSHIDEICEGGEIIGLSWQQLQEFFKNKFFQNFVLSTSRALRVLSQWVLRNLEKREAHFDKLIKCFNTNSLEPAEVFKHLDTCILYNKSELCMYRFLDYLVQNNWMLSNFKSRYDGLHIKYGQLVVSCDKNEEECTKSDKILVSDKNETSSQNNFSSVLVKTRLRNKKQLILKRLMLYGLKPSLRIAALKMLTSKKKPLPLADTGQDEDEEETDDKLGIKCPICFTNINDSLLLEQHLALSHAKDVTYKCGICSFVCQYHGDYLNHMKSHFTGPPYKCDYCDTTADQISKLISHRAQHLEESIYQCTFCSFKCRLKQNFVSHLKIHTPDKSYKCEQCSKSFRFKKNLESHMLTHSNAATSSTADKNLTCESCGFHTKFLSHMIAHKRIHAVFSLGDIYRCSYPHCKYSTAKKNQLASHAKTHNGVRPHSCGICGRGFMEKSHLVRHERIHLEEKPFKCSNCDYASSRRDKLKEHFTRHHGENASAKVPYKARPMRNNSTRSKSTQSSSSQETVTSTNNHFPPQSAGSGTSGSGGGSTASATATAVNQPPPPAPPAAPAIPNNEIQDLIMHHHQNHSSSASSSSSSAAAPATNLSQYHHFGDPTADFHHHHPSSSHHPHHPNHPHHPHHHHHNAVAAAAHAHNIHNQLLASAAAVASSSAAASHGQRSSSSTAAAAAAAAAAAGSSSASSGSSGGGAQQHHNNNNLVNHHMLTAASRAAAAAGNHSTATSTAAAVAAAMMLDPRFHHNSSVPYHPTSTPVSMAMAAVQSSQQIQGSGQHSDYPPSLQNCMTLF